MSTAHPQIRGLAEWRPLARGGFAIVWEARQESLDRLVAVKVDQRTLDDEKEQRRFLREAGAAGRLSGHPGIVTVHDAGILPDDRPYLVMELCPGGSLTKWLTPEGRPPEERILAVGIRIADALAAAHSRGVLHRDVKPANILIDAYDNPGLADFGLAAFPEPGVELSVTLEALTPAYAPKEAFYLHTPTEVADVFSLAATLYAVLSGRPPRWPGSGTPSLPEVLELQQHPILPLSGVHPAFMGVLMTALSDDPAVRPNAAQFRDRLLGVNLSAPPTPVGVTGSSSSPERSETSAPASLPDAAGPEVGPDAVLGPTPEELRPAPRRRRGAVAALIVLAAVLLVLLVGSLLRPGVLDATPRGGPTSASVPTTTSEPSGSTSPSVDGTPSTDATPSASIDLPAGYADCSAELGGTTFCLTEPECWGGLISLSDLPTIGSMQDCGEAHVYQAFAAGQLDYVIRRQSQLEDDPQVQQVCSLETLESRLASGKVKKNWETLVLPPQVTDDDATDTFYRCLVGTDTRQSPIKLKGQ